MQGLQRFLGLRGSILLGGNIFSRLKGGGIWRIYDETIPRIVASTSDIQFIIHLPTACPLPFSPTKNIQYWQEPRLGTYGWRKWIKEQVIRKRNPKIFQATYYELAPWPGMRTVTTVYDFIDARLPLLGPNGQQFVERQRESLKKSEVVIAISEATKIDAVRFADINPDRVRVIPLAAGSQFSNRVQYQDGPLTRFLTNGKNYWLYVGSRLPYKNFNTLLRAFIQVANQTEEDLLVIGGGGSLESWQIERLVRARLDHRVHVHSRVDDFLLVRAYAGASAFVYPSLAEGFGIPILEAMSCGTPTVLSDIPVFHEVSGEAAMFFDPRKEEALADCLLTISRRSEELKAAGFENVKRYDWDLTAQAFADVYESLV